MHRKILFGIFFFLFTPLVYSQEFVTVTDSSLYKEVNTTKFLPPDTEKYALLRWKIQPGTTAEGAGSRHVISAEIIPYVNLKDQEIHFDGYGLYFQDYNVTPSIRTEYSVIDSNNIYTYSTPVTDRFLSEIQQRLTEINLGTIQQRKDYILGLKGRLELPQLIDVDGVLNGVLSIIKPYALIFICLYGSLLCVGKGFQLLESFINQRRKLERKVIRRAQREAQLNDLQYGVLSFNLGMAAAQYESTHSRIDRKAYKAAFREYAAYRESKGWVY